MQARSKIERPIPARATARRRVSLRAAHLRPSSKYLPLAYCSSILEQVSVLQPAPLQEALFSLKIQRKRRRAVSSRPRREERSSEPPLRFGSRAKTAGKTRAAMGASAILSLRLGERLGHRRRAMAPHRLTAWASTERGDVPR